MKRQRFRAIALAAMVSVLATSVSASGVYRGGEGHAGYF